MLRTQFSQPSNGSAQRWCPLITTLSHIRWQADVDIMLQADAPLRRLDRCCTWAKQRPESVKPIIEWAGYSLTSKGAQVPTRNSSTG